MSITNLRVATVAHEIRTLTRKECVVNEELQLEVHRGHVDECANHFFRYLASTVPKSFRQAAKLKEAVARFCGVKTTAVQRWTVGRSKPVGGAFVKFMIYLDMCGYKVIELERMESTLRNFCELIGYGVMSADDASKLLGYTETASLYYGIKGKSGFSKEKISAMYEAWKERKEDLEQKKVAARQRYLIKITPGTEGETMTKPKRSSSQKGLKACAVREDPAVTIMHGLLGLLEDRSSGDSLEAFNSSVEVVARLSARLSDLSSRLIAKQSPERRT